MHHFLGKKSELQIFCYFVITNFLMNKYSTIVSAYESFSKNREDHKSDPSPKNFFNSVYWMNSGS